MNINTLEKLTRNALKGDKIAASSNEMLNRGAINPAEHRSLKSLSWQIAANVGINGGTTANTVAIIRPAVTWL